MSSTRFAVFESGFLSGCCYVLRAAQTLAPLVVDWFPDLEGAGSLWVFVYSVIQ